MTSCAGVRWWLGLVLLFGGCDRVFGLDGRNDGDGDDASIDGDGSSSGPDLDLDGIGDAADPCIAARLDGSSDYDLDGIRNDMDPCPLDDTTSISGDADGDSIPDRCDPFAAAEGDSVRCFMKFSNSDLNTLLWRERGATSEWMLPSNQLATSDIDSTASLVSTLRLEGSDVPTFDVDLTIDGDSSLMIEHAVQIWGRAADAVDQSDIGCQLTSDPAATRLQIINGGGGDLAQDSATGVAFPLGVAIRMRLTYAVGTAGTNVFCSATANGRTWTVSTRATIPATGRFGFGVLAGQVSITGLAIYDRSQLP